MHGVLLLCLVLLVDQGITARRYYLVLLLGVTGYRRITARRYCLVLSLAPAL